MSLQYVLLGSISGWHRHAFKFEPSVSKTISSYYYFYLSLKFVFEDSGALLKNFLEVFTLLIPGIPPTESPFIYNYFLFINEKISIFPSSFLP